MTTNIITNTNTSISAFSFYDLPEQENFMFCDESLLEQKQIYASQIVELHDLIHDNGVPDYPIIFCNIPNMRGCVYLESDFSYHLMFLDNTRANTIELLRETYLHEAAHLLSDGQDHDFAFAVVYNTFRLLTGFPASDNDYDYRACDLEDLSLDMTKMLCEQFAQTIINADLPLVQTIENLKGYLMSINQWLEIDPDNIDEALASFTHHVKFISSHCN